MKKLLCLTIIMTIVITSNCQDISLVELFKLNSKSTTELKKNLELKGYVLTKSGPGAYGVKSFTWVSKDKSATLFFRELSGSASSLHYSPISIEEHNAFKKQILVIGFKQIPYDNRDPDTHELTTYKKGQVEVSFFITDKKFNGQYSVSVSD